MSAYPDLATYFFEMEKLVEAQPDSVLAEIARGAYAMSPRPRPRHGALQARLTSFLEGKAGIGGRNYKRLSIDRSDAILG